MKKAALRAVCKEISVCLDCTATAVQSFFALLIYRIQMSNVNFFINYWNSVDKSTRL